MFTGKKLTNKFDMTGKCILYGLQPNKVYIKEFSQRFGRNGLGNVTISVR
jgi:hypothetical protein